MNNFMRKTGVVVTLSIVFVLFLSMLAYIMLPEVFKLTIRSVVEVPLCNSRTAKKLGIQPDAVRSYVIESLQPGMTPGEVEETLTQIAPISMLDTSIDGSGNTFVSMRVKLCNNPLGDLVLDLYYSKDGDLIRAEDAWAD